MGRVGLEIFRMSLYMAFPVLAFHFFNQPAYFEKWVTNVKREMYPPEREEDRQKIDELKKYMRQKQQQEILAAIQENEMKAAQ